MTGAIAQQNLVRETYNAYMDCRTGKSTPDETRDRLRTLREQAGDQWETIKFRAMAYDANHNA